MKTRTGLLILFVLSTAVLTGCLGTRSIPEPSPTNPVLLVDYQRTGGIGGMDDRIVIFDNGAAVIRSHSASREITLNRTSIGEIAGAFDKAQFDRLEGNYTTARDGADLIHYSITYRGKTVITEDTAVPSPLEPVIVELNRILDTGLEAGSLDLPLPRFSS
jgi:hypothetical protein